MIFEHLISLASSIKFVFIKIIIDFVEDVNPI